MVLQGVPTCISSPSVDGGGGVAPSGACTPYRVVGNSRGDLCIINWEDGSGGICSFSWEEGSGGI